MKIGIIVYSQTGHTLFVAEKLREKLVSAGHEATVEQITPSGSEQQDVKNIRYGALPDVKQYDALVLGAPVQAFSLAPAMVAYLPLLPLLGGKPVGCFVTKQLKSAWTGGNGSIAKIKEVCVAKGARFCGSGIVAWSSKQRDKDIDALVKKLSCLFN